MSTTQRYAGAVSPAPQGANLADVLERVLDKGLVVAGDIRINLLDIELLTIKIRLLLVSADKAKELGIDWWSSDAFLSGKNGTAGRDEELLTRIERLESRIPTLEGGDRGDTRQHRTEEQRDGG